MPQLHVFLSDAEYTGIKEQAKATGLSISTYIRSLAKGKVLKVRPPETYANILRQLSAIGNNINQIAKVANSCGNVRQADVDYIIERQSHLWDMIREL